MNNKARGFFGERPLPKFEVDTHVLRRRTLVLTKDAVEAIQARFQEKEAA